MLKNFTASMYMLVLAVLNAMFVRFLINACPRQIGHANIRIKS